MNLNKVFLIGRLVDDPEIRMTPSGQNIANFRIATNRTWIDSITKEKKEKAEFHNIVAWGRLGEIIGQYLKKGSIVFIEGRIETRSWIDQNNQKHYRTEIIAEGMQMGPKLSGGGLAKNSNQGNIKQEEELPTVDLESGGADAEEVNPDDIPF